MFNSHFLENTTTKIKHGDYRGFWILVENVIHELVHACQRITQRNSCCMSEIKYKAKKYNSINASLAVEHETETRMKQKIFSDYFKDLFEELEKEYILLWS